MRSRLSLFMNSLTLEELMFLEEEIERHKQPYTRQYSVLSVHTDRPVLLQHPAVSLASLARDLRRLMTESAAVGGGTLLAFSPERCLMLFNEIEQTSRSCAALYAGLPEFNGRGESESYKIGLKLGVASGEDTLGPGAPRSVRSSATVRRANECAWRSANGVILMDEATSAKWPGRQASMRMAFDIDGQHIYRATPELIGSKADRFDNSALQEFVEMVSRSGCGTIKYDLRHLEADPLRAASGGIAGAITDLTLQAFDPGESKNVNYSEKIAARDFSDRMESLKRVLSTHGLALIRYDLEAQ
ncbi:hypothetical protein HZB60_06585 [candidate division KSB1 bacterium]|nr:hypothetical protein [candidate division KSB1 bacterium]